VRRHSRVHACMSHFRMHVCSLTNKLHVTFHSTIHDVRWRHLRMFSCNMSKVTSQRDATFKCMCVTCHLQIHAVTSLHLRIHVRNMSQATRAMITGSLSNFEIQDFDAVVVVVVVVVVCRFVSCCCCGVVVLCCPQRVQD